MVETMSKEAENLMMAMKELHTLRARVGELEVCLNGLHLFAGRGDGHETADKVTDCIAGVIIQLRADLEKTEARAESAEARVKELEAWVRDLESDARADAEMLHKRDDRIADLESQLESARSSEGMLRALIALLDRDGGQKQAGESLVESCARASHTLVAERHATFIEHEEIAAAREDLGASELFARALIAKIDRDGGKAQLGESLQYSCHRAIGVVAEAFAELDRLHSGKRLSIEELNTLWQASGRNVERFADVFESHLRAILEVEAKG